MQEKINQIKDLIQTVLKVDQKQIPICFQRFDQLQVLNKFLLIRNGLTDQKC